MQVVANAPWFSFSTEVLLSDFKVYRFTGQEAVSTSYEFSIELVSKSADVDFLEYIGKPACLSITDRSGGKRLVHGLIREMEQLHTANVYTHYRCYLVPRLWFLEQHCDHRIFQHMSVVDIISDVLQRQGFTDECFEFKCHTNYEPREYCVQYGESDFHFINRLCEEEGIYYYFEHSRSSHKLCFCDMPGGPRIPGESNLRYFQGSGKQADTAVVARLQLHQKVNSDAASFREWNFEKPSLYLECPIREGEFEKAPTPAGTNLEKYQFPHLYTLQKPGERYAELQLLRQLTWHTWIDGETDVSRLIPSYVFTLHSHKRRDLNAGWWIVSVNHRGEQPQALEHEAPDRGMEYNATFSAIPEKTKFMPELKHPKVRIEGLQSAIVTGPGGEEIYVDKYGRVKVQFHWDRLGKNDENTTCWVRVADTWAGTNFGFIQAPRIGQEVIVEFMEGDPDRPVITGRVYNAENMPPWQLPDQKVLSGIQSREIQSSGRNQLVFDDTHGEIQAQMSSDQGLSQLNLGYITRLNHVEGRKEFRGEGFELRTDNWGVIRAAKGLYVTTNPRNQAEEHQKDMREAISDIKVATRQHKETSELAEVCGAREYQDGVASITDGLDLQYEQIMGEGTAHAELEAPHIVMASPAGIAVTTPESTHIHTGGNTAITSEQQTSISSNKNFLVSAMEMVGIFAYRLGMRLMAAKGKVEIEAQSDEMNIIADKHMKIFSTNQNVYVSSPKQILLAAGGSYIKISEKGIEHGTSGEWKAHAASHSMLGPKTRPWLKKAWKDGKPSQHARVVVRDELGKVLDTERYGKDLSQHIDSSSTEHPLHMINNPQPEEVLVHTETVKGVQHIASFGTTVNLTAQRSKDIPKK